MKDKILIIFIFFVFIILVKDILALDTLSCNYFPLKVGNAFYYRLVKVDQNLNKDTVYFATRIVDTVNYNGKKYFDVRKFIWLGDTMNYFIRYDSTNGNLKKYSGSSPSCGYELKMFPLAAHTNDTIGFYCGLLNYSPQVLEYKCDAEGNVNVFGYTVSYKRFKYNYNLIQGYILCYTTLAYNFGISSVEYNIQYGVHTSKLFYLKGAKINGIVYGDTNITDIKKIGSTIPESYYLFQNYPNPFNSMTNIKFQMLNVGVAKITVSDLLGKEVATLVNEKLQPGVYSVRFDAGTLPSGIYFYRLVTENFIETKKFILLK